LEYSQKLDEISSGTSTTKSLWQGIDLDLLIKQQAYVIDMKRRLEAPQSYATPTHSPNPDALVKRKPAPSDATKNHPLHHHHQKSTPVTTPVPQKLPVQLESPMIRPQRPLGPTVTPSIVQAATQNTSLFDRVLDSLMGGDDLNVHCGNCKSVHACVGKDQELHDFICGQCRAVNKITKKPTNPGAPKLEGPTSTASTSSSTTSTTTTTTSSTSVPAMTQDNELQPDTSNELEKEKKD